MSNCTLFPMSHYPQSMHCRPVSVISCSTNFANTLEGLPHVSTYISWRYNVYRPPRQTASYVEPRHHDIQPSSDSQRGLLPIQLWPSPVIVGSWLSVGIQGILLLAPDQPPDQEISELFSCLSQSLTMPRLRIDAAATESVWGSVPPARVLAGY